MNMRNVVRGILILIIIASLGYPIFQTVTETEQTTGTEMLIPPGSEHADPEQRPGREAAGNGGILSTGGSLEASPRDIPVLDWRNLRELNHGTGDMTPNLRRHNGQLVKIPGFMVPLEDEATVTTEFLLVPYPQACIHVPAPPPNQIVHVKMEEGKRTNVVWWEPIWAYGILNVETTTSIYAEASFTMVGQKTEMYDDY